MGWEGGLCDTEWSGKALLRKRHLSKGLVEGWGVATERRRGPDGKGLRPREDHVQDREQEPMGGVSKQVMWLDSFSNEQDGSGCCGHCTLTRPPPHRPHWQC